MARHVTKKKSETTKSSMLNAEGSPVAENQ